MLRLDTKSNLLKFTFLVACLFCIYAAVHKWPADKILSYGSAVSGMFCLGWLRFYRKHKFFFQFANYETGAAIVLFDESEKGRIIWCNEEACKLIGWSQSELIGKTAEDLVEDCNTPEFAATLEKAKLDLKTHGKAAVEFTYKRKDNHFVKLKSMLYAKYDNAMDGAFKGVIGFTIQI